MTAVPRRDAIMSLGNTARHVRCPGSVVDEIDDDRGRGRIRVGHPDDESHKLITA